MPIHRPDPPVPGRQVIRQACDCCRVRKIKCSGLTPCSGCTASRIQCTFKKVPKKRGPRALRPKTVQQVTQRQRQRQHPVDAENDTDYPTSSGSFPSPSQTAGIETSHKADTHVNPRTAHDSLDLRLSTFRLRLYPVWPIVEVADLLTTLKENDEDNLCYALANAVGAATIAQLKLDSWHDAASASSMEAECCRVKDYRDHRRVACLDTLRIAFFLHVYHENLEPGGVASVSYLREAITLSQIMGLHRESTYGALSPSQQELRRKVFWLLFVTERGVAILHHLPVILKCHIQFPSIDGENEGILTAFRKLVHLFWIFEKSGAFDVLQSIDDEPERMNVPNRSQSSLEILQQRLQDVPIEREAGNDVQRADICVTRQWMRAVLWRLSFLQDSNLFTSLCLPIQIAQDFLAVISKLPTAAIESHGPSIEFKIFEIASAVTDALANVHLRAWAFPENTSNVLNQLYRILMSCRGGNETLSTMLRVKIAQIQDQAPLFLPLNSRIQEVLELDHARTTTATGADADAEDASFSNIPSLLKSRETGNSIIISERAISNAEMDFFRRPLVAPTAGDASVWSSLIGTGPFRPPTNIPWDSNDQLLSFDGSFDDCQAFETLDQFMPASETSQLLRGGFPSPTPPSPTLSL